MSDYASLSDRELDAAVAEKVMGWKADEYHWRWNDKDLGACCLLIGAWHPSISIRDAWQVIEKLDKHIVISRFDSKQYSVGFPFDLREAFEDKQVEHQSYGPSAPRAICIAALMAVEARDE